MGQVHGARKFSVLSVRNQKTGKVPQLWNDKRNRRKRPLVHLFHRHKYTSGPLTAVITRRGLFDHVSLWNSATEKSLASRISDRQSRAEKPLAWLQNTASNSMQVPAPHEGKPQSDPSKAAPASVSHSRFNWLASDESINAILVAWGRTRCDSAVQYDGRAI